MLLLLLVSPLVSSAEPMPKCFDGATEIQPMNETVVQYKQTMPNLRKFQVMVKATLVKMMPNTSNAFGTHEHFIVSLRDNTSDAAAQIEIAHSMNEYTAPSEIDLRAGPIFLCGEYSTTRADGMPKITKFTPSATGAMIHWTHQATNNLDTPVNGHPNGWIYANGKVFGRYATKPL